MKHLKILALLVTAATSLMAFASSAAAAPTLTSPAGTEYRSVLHASLEFGTSTTFKAGIEDTCTESTAGGLVSTNIETHAESPLATLTFSHCTQDTRVVFPGSLTVDGNGTVFTWSSRWEIKVTSLGVTCFYGGELGSVDIGKLTPSNTTFSTTATLDVNTTELPREPGSNAFFCASKATWTGSYVITTPEPLLLK
jgi:hypothetical protein